MKFRVAPDARPQVTTLLMATILSIALWFIPFAEYLVYPLRLFVTFIHEGGHVLASIITGSGVQSLMVSMDTSGMVLSSPSSWLASLLVSSAGYLGATAFGALLLVLIRRNVSPAIVLTGTAVYITFLTVVFGLLLPFVNILGGQISLSGIAFTVVSGLLISGGLIAIARYTSQRTANFFLSFLAVQCLLNAIFDLKTVFFLSSPFGPHIHTDAVNMFNATGVPGIFWTILWIGISIVMVSLALRFYATSKDVPVQQDLPFED